MKSNNLAIKTIDSIVSASRFSGVLKANLTREEDPTGQGSNRARLNKKIKSRLANARKEIVDAFRLIPATPKRESNISLNQDTFTTYEYEIPDPDLLYSEINLIMSDWLLTYNGYSDVNVKPEEFYSDENVDEATNAGAQETVRDVNQQLNIFAAIAGALIATMPRRIEPQFILISVEFDQIRDSNRKKFYQQLNGLSEKTSKQVYGVMIEGMNGNKTKREIIKDITRRFQVAESGARRIVETEINKYNNNARMDAIDIINQSTSLKAIGMHKSALLPTTRRWHAARNDKYYTAAQQRRWWDEGTNRINCHCSFVPVLVDKNNKPLVSLQSL